MEGGWNIAVPVTVPLSMHIAALEKDLRFGRAGRRTGRGTKDQKERSLLVFKGPWPGLAVYGCPCMCAVPGLPCRVVVEFQQSQKG